MLRDDDITLGQLALARGLLAFPDLLHSIHAMRSEEATSLEDVLVARGHVSYAQIVELREAATQGGEQVRAEIESGKTLVLDHIEHTRKTRGTFPSQEVLEPRRTLDDVAALSTAAPPSSLRTLLDEHETAATRYTLMRELGRGGMGEVWLARDHVMGREVALKMLHTEDDERRDTMRRNLMLEAQLTGMLEHPSIIPVYDVGELEDRGLYYTMRVVREESLEQKLTKIREGANTDKLTSLINILRTALLALQYAHDHGVVHRDLKPENILVGAYGEVFVIDWGVAKIRSSELTDSLGRNSIQQTREGSLVGTPQYMAPEQALGEQDRIDERTDVYAMGVILYEMLTLEPVFEAGHVLALLLKVTETPPTPPTERNPERNIPEVLEEICLKALAKAPEDRYQSAQEMARELELFLEGVKESRRAQERAEELVAQGHRALTRYTTCREEYEALRDTLAARQLEVPTWAPMEEKEELWRLEGRVFEARTRLEHEFGNATRTFGQALGYVPDHPEAHKNLTKMYWERFMEAENKGDEANAIYFEGLVRQHDDGTFAHLLEGQASLTVRLNAPTPEVAVAIYRYERGLHRLEEVHITTLDHLPERHQLPHGSYVLHIRAPQMEAVRIPIHLDRAARVEQPVTLRPQGSLPADIVVITAGHYSSGQIQGSRRHLEWVDDFGIMREPVTCGDYADFLTALATRGDEALARRCAPRIEEDAETYFDYDPDARCYTVPTQDDDGDAWHPDWPICMIDARSAEAYADWRAERDGLPFRLPTDREWEKAARGVDGRIYAWGNDFDAAFCRMRESERGRPLPAPVGSYAMDRSPYGVMDMTGNVHEWTATPYEDDPSTRVIRGSCFGSFKQGCRLDWTLSSPATFRSAYYGFRLAVDL